MLLRAACAAGIASGASLLLVDAPARSVADTPSPRGGRVALPAGGAALVALPGGGKRAVRSLLATDRPLRYGDFLWDDRGLPPGKLWVRVDLKAQTISVFRADQEIGTALILYGMDAKPTPAGRYAVLEKHAEHRSSLYDAEMPYTLRLSADGIAIHASDVRGGAATHGCIGVPYEFARRLFAAARRGDEVLVVA